MFCCLAFISFPVDKTKQKKKKEKNDKLEKVILKMKSITPTQT